MLLAIVSNVIGNPGKLGIIDRLPATFSRRNFHRSLCNDACFLFNTLAGLNSLRLGGRWQVLQDVVRSVFAAAFVDGADVIVDLRVASAWSGTARTLGHHLVCPLLGRVLLLHEGHPHAGQAAQGYVQHTLWQQWGVGFQEFLHHLVGRTCAARGRRRRGGRWRPDRGRVFEGLEAGADDGAAQDEDRGLLASVVAHKAVGRQEICQACHGAWLFRLLLDNLLLSLGHILEAGIGLARRLLLLLLLLLLHLPLR
mmetsp:Transcript_14935/g.38708  ORF Transcript_14935/g.38708 Transcript_14935/m.38708 type:complete len:254 (+) Transcript_14935:498-1259(+)